MCVRQVYAVLQLWRHQRGMVIVRSGGIGRGRRGCRRVVGRVEGHCGDVHTGRTWRTNRTSRRSRVELWRPEGRTSRSGIGRVLQWVEAWLMRWRRGGCGWSHTSGRGVSASEAPPPMSESTMRREVVQRGMICERPVVAVTVIDVMTVSVRRVGIPPVSTSAFLCRLHVLVFLLDLLRLCH
jgi:hypothetical protein